MLLCDPAARGDGVGGESQVQLQPDEVVGMRV